MLRNLFCMFVAAFSLVVLAPIAILTMLVFWDTGASIWWARKVWSPVLLWAGGALLDVAGREHVDQKRPTIYVSNHQSTIDIPTLFMAIPVNVRFIAKRQLLYVPFLGVYLWLAKFILIDRSNRTRAIASLAKAAKRIRNGVSIIVYAEGTRSPDGSILPFKKGPFALALQAKVPICPVAIEGSGKLMPKNRWTITPGPIRVKIGAPIDTSSFGDDREALVKRVRDEIIALNLELGGKGGDRDDVVAAPGLEGVGRRSTGGDA